MNSPIRPMNYRHAYHAGNAADVLKHVVLIELLESFKAKATPFCYIDTHAGRGQYDLGDEAALKTAEASDGVLRLLAMPDSPAPLRKYLDMVRALQPEDVPVQGLRYPGSPLIAAQLLRANDRAVLCELQVDEARALRVLLRDHPASHVHQRDGHEALRALLPPREKRGLVLIDPPFEAQRDEFRLIEAALDEALTRWPSGRYAVWYPIKLREDVRPFQRWLERRVPGQWLAAEFLWHPDTSSDRLNGCGMAIINPPWQFEHTLDAVLDALCQCLASHGFSEKRLLR